MGKGRIIYNEYQRTYRIAKYPNVNPFSILACEEGYVLDGKCVRQRLHKVLCSDISKSARMIDSFFLFCYIHTPPIQQ